MMKTDIPVVTITKMGKRWNYFQVFILGLYELERQGKILLRFRCEWLYRLSTIFAENRYVGWVINKLNYSFSHDSYNMYGTVEFKGTFRHFCIDCADAPYLFDSHDLDKMDVYFKMQCPKVIDPQHGFRLTDEVIIPFVDHQHENPNNKLTDRAPRKILTNLSVNIHKIKPLIVGFRRLSKLNSYQALKCGYDNYRQGVVSKPSKRLMCYFGNALGPKPEENVSTPDWDWEADILGYYKELVNHPNEKRGKLAKIISTLGDKYDARVISEVEADTKNAIKHDEFIIPIEKFCRHISNFEYNLNVSGYRMSIPNRFMESFVVGTAIVTDKLAVKWFLPFDDEVVETEKMGYLLDKDVDWQKVKDDLKSLPPVSKNRILCLYDEKWRPDKIADYMIKTILTDNPCNMAE